MAQTEFDIPYKPTAHNSLRNFFVAWLVVGIALALFLAHGLIPMMSGSGTFIQYAYWLTFTLLTGALYSGVPYLVYVSAGQQSQLHASKDGLGLPGSVGLIPGFRLWRTWADLEAVELVRKEPLLVSKDDYLLLKYKTSAAVKLYLLGFSAHDLEHLLLAIEVSASGCRRSEAVLIFQDTLHNADRGLNSEITYTKIWEDELARRFQSTTFIPHEPGTLVGEGRLKIIRQLAFGGTAAIYLARDRFQNEVIVKESVTGVEAQSESESKAIEFFEREAKLLMVLKHPQIAKVLDHFVENKRQYLVLEYVPGQNLRRLVNIKGALPERQVLELARQMTDILAYLHTHKPPVMHRDFTPDNLLLRPDGKLILVDFGAANEYITTATGTLVGKQCYMPPEQVRGKTTPSSDLYAMGGTLFFLLTGSDPEALSVCHPQLFRQNTTSATDSLVASLTAMDSTDRPQSAQLAGIAVESILSDFPEVETASAQRQLDFS